MLSIPYYGTSAHWTVGLAVAVVGPFVPTVVGPLVPTRTVVGLAVDSKGVATVGVAVVAVGLAVNESLGDGTEGLVVGVRVGDDSVGLDVV
jgi:hypothetical protein